MKLFWTVLLLSQLLWPTVLALGGVRSILLKRRNLSIDDISEDPDAPQEDSSMDKSQRPLSLGDDIKVVTHGSPQEISEQDSVPPVPPYSPPPSDLPAHIWDVESSPHTIANGMPEVDPLTDSKANYSNSRPTKLIRPAVQSVAAEDHIYDANTAGNGPADPFFGSKNSTRSPDTLKTSSSDGEGDAAVRPSRGQHVDNARPIRNFNHSGLVPGLYNVGINPSTTAGGDEFGTSTKPGAYSGYFGGSHSQNLAPASVSFSLPSSGNNEPRYLNDSSATSAGVYAYPRHTTQFYTDADPATHSVEDVASTPTSPSPQTPTQNTTQGSSDVLHTSSVQPKTYPSRLSTPTQIDNSSTTTTFLKEPDATPADYGYSNATILTPLRASPMSSDGFENSTALSGSKDSGSEATASYRSSILEPYNQTATDSARKSPIGLGADANTSSASYYPQGNSTTPFLHGGPNEMEILKKPSNSTLDESVENSPFENFVTSIGDSPPTELSMSPTNSTSLPLHASTEEASNTAPYNNSFSRGLIQSASSAGLSSQPRFPNSTSASLNQPQKITKFYGASNNESSPRRPQKSDMEDSPENRTFGDMGLLSSNDTPPVDLRALPTNSTSLPLLASTGTDSSLKSYNSSLNGGLVNSPSNTSSATHLSDSSGGAYFLQSKPSAISDFKGSNITELREKSAESMTNGSLADSNFGNLASLNTTDPPMDLKAFPTNYTSLPFSFSSRKDSNSTFPNNSLTGGLEGISSNATSGPLSSSFAGTGLQNSQNHTTQTSLDGEKNRTAMLEEPLDSVSGGSSENSTLGNLAALNSTSLPESLRPLPTNSTSLPLLSPKSAAGAAASYNNSLAGGLDQNVSNTDPSYRSLISSSSSPLNKSAFTYLNSTGAMTTYNTPKSCELESINPTVWKKNHIAQFLQTYPGGQAKNVTDFARENHVFNWECQIGGEVCNAGQICGPIPGPLWQVFVSLQNYMNLQSVTIKAVTFASNMLQTVAAGLAIDLLVWGSISKEFQYYYDLFSFSIGDEILICSFFNIYLKKSSHKPDTEKYKRLFKIEEILTLAVGISAVVCAAVMWVAPAGQGVALGIVSGISAAIATSQAGVTIAAQDALKEIKSSAFNRWAAYSESIGNWEQKSHQNIFNQTNLFLSSGISTENGLYGAFKEGDYFLDVQPKSIAQIENTISEVATARLISSILISKDECDKDGPNGAFKIEDGWLSYCDKKNGNMMNIVAVKEKDHDHVDNHLYNAIAIPTKYNISVEYMVKQSVDCQKRYGGWSYDPYKNGSLPMDKNADCIVNLPVCYCKDWNGVRKYKRRHGTVLACRKKGKLPI